MSTNIKIGLSLLVILGMVFLVGLYEIGIIPNSDLMYSIIYKIIPGIFVGFAFILASPSSRQNRRLHTRRERNDTLI